MESLASIDLSRVRSGAISSFKFLKIANEYLSSPQNGPVGREYIIRALDNIEYFFDNKATLKILVRKSGLYPYLHRYFDYEKYEHDGFLLSLYESGIDGFIFHSMQAKVFNSLISGENIILGAPTSMGKSAVIDSLLASGRFNNVVVVVPTIALIDETRRRISTRFGSKFQVIHHGSQVRTKERVVYVLTQERVNERDDLENVDIFVIDEFYKLAYSNDDDGRVVSLNIALSKLMLVSKQFFMIGPYIDFVRGMDCFNRDFKFITTDFNTVALNLHKYNIPPTDDVAKREKLREILEDNSGQTIVYCKSQNSISNVIEGIDYVDSGSNNSDYIDWVESNYGEDWIYTKAMSRGIGIHHGSLPRAIQQKTVELFNSKNIRLLFCTSTLIEGVNTSAENVVIYDNRRANHSIDTFTQSNISGRAGRMNQYLVGNVYSLEGDTKNEVSSNVVEVALADQGRDDSLNMLASLQNEHLTEQGERLLSAFREEAVLPIEIYKKHSSYSVGIINDAYRYIDDFSVDSLKLFLDKKPWGSEKISILTGFIKKVEFRSLQRMSLHFDDNKELQNRISWYLYSENYSDYIGERLKHIYDHCHDARERSNQTEKELRIVRHLFKYSVPRAISLFQDLANIELSIWGDGIEIDLGHILHIFENTYLPSVLSAVEEMGVPIETLEKLNADRLENSSLDAVFRYLRRFYNTIPGLSEADRMFIELAVAN